MNKFDINNIAFEIHECYITNKLTEEFIEAWRSEWNRIHESIHDVSGTTVLGDVVEYKRLCHFIINGNIMWEMNKNK